MPLVGFRPNTPEMEEVLNKSFSDASRPRVKKVISDISGFPTTDVLVTLHRCDTRNSDPDAADYIVHINTCPNENLEEHAEELLERIAQALIDLGLTKGLTVEVWPKFLPGPWCMIVNDEIVDRVKHVI